MTSVPEENDRVSDFVVPPHDKDYNPLEGFPLDVDKLTPDDKLLLSIVIMVGDIAHLSGLDGMVSSVRSALIDWMEKRNLITSN
jgi:hypothetical protein